MESKVAQLEESYSQKQCDIESSSSAELAAAQVARAATEASLRDIEVQLKEANKVLEMKKRECKVNEELVQKERKRFDKQRQDLEQKLAISQENKGRLEKDKNELVEKVSVRCHVPKLLSQSRLIDSLLYLTYELIR